MLFAAAILFPIVEGRDAPRPAGETPAGQSHSKRYTLSVLAVTLDNVSFSYRAGFRIENLSLTFPRARHTGLVGPSGAGTTTILRLIAGDLRPSGGDIQIGARPAGRLRASARPVLAVPETLAGWWSVRHALIAAVRRRTLDRIDRFREFAIAVEKWRLTTLLDRRVRTLSQSERVLVQLARIELLRPGILVADRLLAGVNPALAPWAGEEIYRTLRVIGTTVISVPATTAELGWADRVVAIEHGSVVQEGSPSELFSAPAGESVAQSLGPMNAVPVSIRGNRVHSVIGEWEVSKAPFQGSGIALVRPDEFSVARPGEDSDFIFGVEEASFQDGQWMASGLLSGGFAIRVALPRGVEVHKGKLLPLRYDPTRFPLIRKDIEMPRTSAPTDVVPPLRETR